MNWNNLNFIFILLWGPWKGPFMINSLQNLSEAEFEVPSVSLHTCLQPFSDPQNCFINGVLGETVPYLWQHIFEFSFCLGLRPVLLMGSKHHTPDAKIHRIKIWGVWRPFILFCITLYNPVTSKIAISSLQCCIFNNFASICMKYSPLVGNSLDYICWKFHLPILKIGKVT